MLCEWRTCKCPTEELETRLNEITANGFDVFKLEYICTGEYDHNPAMNYPPTYGTNPGYFVQGSSFSRMMMGMWVIVAVKYLSE